MATDSATVPARPLTNRYLLVSIAFPAAVTLAAIIVQLSVLTRLPNPIAVHWSLHGKPDQFAAAWITTALTGAIGVGFPTLIALLAIRELRRGRGGGAAIYRFTCALAVGISAFLGTLLTWTVVMQVGLANAQDAYLSWAALIVSLGLGVVVLAAAWFALPNGDRETGPPRPTSPLSLTTTERAVWVRRASFSKAGLIPIFAGVGAVTVAAIVAWMVAETLAMAWLLTGIAVILLLLALSTTVFWVRVDQTGLTVRSGIGVPRFRVPVSEILGAEMVSVSPLVEFGGWGMRWVPGRFGIVLRSGQAIQVHRRSGKQFVVTVNDAATGTALLQAFVERQPRRLQ